MGEQKIVEELNILIYSVIFLVVGQLRHKQCRI